MITGLFLVVACLAAAAALLAVWSRLACLNIDQRFEREGREVEIEGGSLNVLELGDTAAEGPPVVLIHGEGANLKDLKVSLGERLARERRVILVDRPGQGWSERIARDDIHTPEGQAIALNDALGRLGVERPLLVGHGWGGALALSYALSYPEEAAGVVAISPISHPSSRLVTTVHRLAAAPVIGWAFSHLVAPTFGPVLLAAALGRAFAPQKAPEDHAEAVALPLGLKPRPYRDTARDMVELEGFLDEQSAYYGQITKPMVIINGELDGITPPGAHAEKLAADVPGSRLVLLNDVGHMPHHTSPNVIVFEINRLADRV